MSGGSAGGGAAGGVGVVLALALHFALKGK